MPNQLITQQVGPVCRQALGLLRETIMLPSLMFFDTGVDGSLACGDTVNVRVPAKFTAKEFSRAAGIEIQDVQEGRLPVVMDKIFDVSVQLTAEELTLDLTDFGRQVTMPAMNALAEAAEGLCVGLLEQTTASVPVTGDKVVEAVIDASAALNANKVPRGQRSLVVGTGFAAKLKKSENLLRVDAAGSSEALREAVVGRLAGATVYESSYVGADDAYMFAPEAFVFATRALETMGASATVGSFEGVSIRTVLDYDITKKASIASWDFLAGGRVLSQERVVKIGGAAAPKTSK